MSAKERPILFSGPMVRAILEGRKTQTRRVIKPQPAHVWGHGVAMPGNIHGVRSDVFHVHIEDREGNTRFVYCPHGKPGDRLLVRETWAWPGEEFFLYRATDQHVQDKMRSDPHYPQFNWKPSIHMPRRASRITLEITGVRVERLQEVSSQDACAEGAAEILDVGHPLRDKAYEHGTFMDGEQYAGAVDAFHALWDSINAKKHPWASNPWVWVIEFKRVSK